MPPPPTLWRRVLAAVLGSLLAANALAMLSVPETWYHTVPGVTATGPLNTHFVRDIGAAYLTSALGLLWLSAGRSAGVAAARLGALFLLLHAGVHVGETLVGLCGWGRLWRDLPAVGLPGVLALWLSQAPPAFAAAARAPTPYLR